MPQTKEQLLRRVLDCGVVAIIRADSADDVPDLARALVAGGVVAVEVTMTTPRALWAIERMNADLGESAVLGVGTVLDAATCRSAVDAGAQFIVSPHFDPEIVAATRRYGKVSVPGAYTPTEILNAWTAGADVVKVFPSASVGPRYFRDVLAPLPQLRLIPTGGVDLSNVGEWIRSGAACVGAGTTLMSKEALAKRDWNAITATARAFVDAVRQARTSG